jgi:hypothetical protein
MGTSRREVDATTEFSDRDLVIGSHHIIFHFWGIELNDIKIYPQILGYIPEIELFPVQL